MRWFYCNNADLVGLECVNVKTDKHLLRLSPNTNFVQDNNDELGEPQVDTRYLVKFVNNIPTLDVIKNILLSLQKDYDVSAEVNSFYINDKRVWLDKATRIGIVNVLKLKQNDDVTYTTLWFGDDAIEVSVNKALEILTSVELYAEKCNNNTRRHINQINELESVEDCLVFDITSGYPDKLNFEV